MFCSSLLPVISRHSISVDYCFKTYGPPKLNGFKQWAFFFAHNSGRSAPWAELGLSVHLLGFPQFLMCFTGVGCLRQPQRGCRGSLPCGLSSSRRLAGFFYMVVSGQHPKRVRVEASKLFWALGLRRHHHWSRQFTIPAQIQGEGKGLYKEFVTI